MRWPEPTSASPSVPTPTPNAEISLTLLDDGGDADDLIGDGLYRGVVTPTLTGRHAAVAEVSGVSAGGFQFAHAVATEFTVRAAVEVV